MATSNKMETEDSRYTQVMGQILDHIKVQRLDAEDQLPSERRFAEMFQVSRPTVNKAIACLIAEGTLHRHGYKLFVKGNEPSADKALTIHVLGGHAEYQRRTLIRHDLVEAAHDVAAVFHANISPLLARNGEEQLPQLRKLLQIPTSGFILWPLTGELRDIVDKFAARGVPFVICDHDFGTYDYVGTDNQVGERLAVEHLYEHGHREIAYVTHVQFTAALERRCLGYQQTCYARHLNASAQRVIEVADFERRQGRYALQQVKEKYPNVTAIAFSHDLLALHFVEAAKAEGIRIPQDLSIIGFDDIDASAISDPPLTTITQDFYMLGTVAAETLFRRIHGAGGNTYCRLSLHPRLTVRKSVQAPAPSGVGRP